jgi:hypothetical protein
MMKAQMTTLPSSSTLKVHLWLRPKDWKPFQISDSMNQETVWYSNNWTSQRCIGFLEIIIAIPTRLQFLEYFMCNNSLPMTINMIETIKLVLINYYSYNNRWHRLNDHRLTIVECQCCRDRPLLLRLTHPSSNFRLNLEWYCLLSHLYHFRSM